MLAWLPLFFTYHKNYFLCISFKANNYASCFPCVQTDVCLLQFSTQALLPLVSANAAESRSSLGLFYISLREVAFLSGSLMA